MYIIKYRWEEEVEKMKISVSKDASGLSYICLALYAFAGLSVEGLYVYLLEPLIYGAYVNSWAVSEVVIHWIATCITWGLVGYGLIKVSKMKYGFDLFETKGKMKAWQWICTLICILFLSYVSYNDWGGFKPFKEYQGLGMLKFIFQYIYYIFETMLFTLILIFGQKACEVWFKKENVPYGGIVVAVTWGLAHILTKGSIIAGLICALAGFSYGIVYLLVNRDIKKAFPILCVMFII